jgi:predicted metal-binding protein
MSRRDQKTTLFVCTVCRQGEEAAMRPGEAFVAALRERLQGEDLAGIGVIEVECLGVCDRPCTAALAGPGKWIYVVGDLDADHVEEFIAAAKAYAASDNGIVPWSARPPCFKKGVVSRTPPLPRDADAPPSEPA